MGRYYLQNIQIVSLKDLILNSLTLCLYLNYSIYPNLNYFDTNKVDMLMDLIAKIAEALNKMIKTLKSQSQS